MERLHKLIATVATLLVFGCGVCYSNDFVRHRTDSDCIVEIARQEIGVQEIGGNNRGARVEEYLCAVNMPKGNPWCAAFVAYVMNQCGVSHLINAFSPTATPRSKMIWSQKVSEQKEKPRPGDVFSLYYKNLGRIGHTGIVESWGETYVTTIEGNTNEDGSRDGDGVWRKKRLIKTIYRVSRWAK